MAKSLADYQAIIDWLNSPAGRSKYSAEPWRRDAQIAQAKQQMELISLGNDPTWVESMAGTIYNQQQGVHRVNAEAKFSTDKPLVDISSQVRDTALANLRAQQLRGLSSVVKKPVGLQLPTMKATVMK